jgi:osmoprotectant transport system ATP-binding protein
MLQFENVSFQIGEHTILKNLNLVVEEGETLVLLGRSGSGKTTAMRMVNAMNLPTEGRVLVEGKSTRDWDPIRLRRRTGYVIQEVGLFPHFTVEQNVALVPRLEGWSSNRTETSIAAILEEVGLPRDNYAHRYPDELSGGQRQRVGVARALAAGPTILLFDEPFGALDPITRLEMQRLFLRLRQQHQTTSIFVTHDVQEALLLGTRIGLLIDGKLAVLAAPDEFVKSDHPEVLKFLEVLDSQKKGKFS